MTKPDIASIANQYIQARWRWYCLRGQALQEYQERRARKIVTYALKHSPFYREYWAGYDPHVWRSLPVIDKYMMMENFDRFTTCGVKRADAMEVALKAERSRDFEPQLHGLTVGLSSGTSGHRGLFLANTWEQSAWAGTILARALHRLPLKPVRIAFFLRSNSNLYEQVGTGLIRFRYFDLMMPLEQAVASLNEFQPDIVIGPPSLLGFLAEAQEQKRLSIYPERLISVAEVLEIQDKERLQKIFQVPVHQIYQCTEGLLAVSCARGSLHIQEDIVVLQFEPVPGDERRVMPIVTDLWRQTQPIIRYRLNDILQLADKPCACGSPFRVIESIEGRSDDLFYFETLTGERRPFFPDTIRRMILLASAQIVDYQVYQDGDGAMQIYLAIVPEVCFADIAEAVQGSVSETLAHYACRPAHVQIYQGLPNILAGTKRRRVQRIKG